MEEEKDKYDINNFLYENNSKRKNQINQNNRLFQNKSFLNNYNSINNYNNNLTENKSYDLYTIKKQKMNYCARPKELNIISPNNNFDEDILNLNYNPGSIRYNQNLNLNDNFSENNILQPKIIYKKKTISHNSSNSIVNDSKYSNLNNLNIKRIFSSVQKPKPKGIINKKENKIFLKKEKEKKRKIKDEEDIKVVDIEKTNFNFRPNYRENAILLKDFNYEIKKLENIINRKKEIEIIIKEIERERELERIEYERKKEEERKMEEYMKRKNEERKRKRIELERRKKEMERKRIEEERRKRDEIALNRQKMEREFQKREENEESQFNSGLFNHLTTNHYINNINNNINNNNNIHNNYHNNYHNNIHNNNIMIIRNINNNTIDYIDINFNNFLNERENEINEDLDNLYNMANNNFIGPIKNDLLNVLPESKIADINKLNEENKKCLICLEEYVNNDNVIYLPCFHIFHKNCIIQWIKNHAICPLCKININEIIK